MCNPCLLSGEIFGPSHTWLLENAQETDKRTFLIPCEGGGIDGRDEGINSPTQNKNELTKTAEGVGRGHGSGRGSGSEGGNKNFTFTILPSEQSFSLTPNEINTNEPRLTLKAKNFAAKIFTAKKFRGFRGCSERKI